MALNGYSGTDRPNGDTDLVEVAGGELHALSGSLRTVIAMLLRRCAGRDRGKQQK